MKATEATSTTDSLWTVKDVADYLRVSTSMVYQRAGAGELPHIKVGALLRFRRSEIDEHLRKKANPEKAGTIRRIK
jgi:excisionase family DNA binding protein